MVEKGHIILVGKLFDTFSWETERNAITKLSGVLRREVAKTEDRSGTLDGHKCVRSTGGLTTTVSEKRTAFMLRVEAVINITILLLGC
jgi:hypothetical protein